MIVSEGRNLTNQLLIDELDLWELFDSKSISDDKTKRYYQLIDSLIDSQIGESIAWLQSDEAKQYFFQEAELQKEIFDALEDSWEDIFDGHYEQVDDLLDAIYDAGKKQGYENIRETLRYNDADRQAIRLAKDYNYDLIRNLTSDVHATVKDKILQGIVMGENPYNLARTLEKAGVTPLKNSPFTARQRATMIAKTETSRMQNTGMVQSYLNEGYTQVKILTAEDNQVCTTCLEYAYHFNSKTRTFVERGKEKVHNIVDLIKGGKFPPFHPLCRCTYLTVWETKTDAPSNPPVINLTPVSAEIRRFERELPEPTREQLMKNLRPGEREKYENYKRNIPKQEQWLRDNPDAPAEEIAKHQKRLDFLQRKFIELKKKALGADAHPKPKKEKPKPVEPNLTFSGEYKTYTTQDKFNGSDMTVREYENGAKITISNDVNITHDEIVMHINSLPEPLRNIEPLSEINVTNHKSNVNGATSSGMVGNKKQTRITIYGGNFKNKPESEIYDTINHELAHAFGYSKSEKNDRQVVSDKKIYQPIFEADNKLKTYINSETGKEEVIDRWPSGYGKAYYEDNGLFTEDFTESSRLYLNPSTHDKFVKDFPNRAEYLESLYGKPVWNKNSPHYKTLVKEGKLKNPPQKPKVEEPTTPVDDGPNEKPETPVEKPVEETPKKEPQPKEPEEPVNVNLNETIDDLRKIVPLSDEAFDEMLNWSKKRVKNKTRYGREYNKISKTFSSREQKGREYVCQFTTSEFPDNVRITSMGKGDDGIPSSTDFKLTRAGANQDFLYVSKQEVWYIHSTENYGRSSIVTGQKEIDDICRNASREARAEVMKMIKEGKLSRDDIPALQETQRKIESDKVLKAFSTKEWQDKGFIVHRAKRDDIKTVTREASKPNTRETVDTTHIDKSKLTYDTLKTPEEIAAFYDLEYVPEVNSKGKVISQKFIDHLTYVDPSTGETINHKTEIVFDSTFVGPNRRKAKNLIDITNSGECKYDQKELVRIYKEAPDIYKFATGSINFTGKDRYTNRSFQWNELGNATWYRKAEFKGTIQDGKYFLKGVNSIMIPYLPLMTAHGKRGTVKQTILHEMSHCFDYSLMTGEPRDLLVKGMTTGLTRSEIDKLNQYLKAGYGHGVSNDKSWKSTKKDERDYQEENNYPQEGASWYGKVSDDPEHWAETGSMAAISLTDDLTDAVMEDYHRDDVQWGDWSKYHKPTLKYAIDKINSVKPSDFTYLS